MATDMAAANGHFKNLERHRYQLELNIAKLQASLQHWQAWELEYEGMKEEISGLRPGHSEAELGKLGEDRDKVGIFEGHATLLTTHERRQLLIDERQRARTSQQVLGLLSRRIEYVQQNIKTVASLLQSGEGKYPVSQIPSEPDVRNEEDLPLKEIHEELDERGEIISSTISEPGEAAPQMVEALRRAGVKVPAGSSDAARPTSEPSQAPGIATPVSVKSSSKGIQLASSAPANMSKISSVSQPSSTSEIDATSARRKKNVGFAEDTEGRSPKNGRSQTFKSILPQSAAGTSRKDIKTQPFSPIIPDSEFPDDAALRQQIIQYNMSEVGAVVAELELDEDGAFTSDDGTEDDAEGSNSVDEDEDKFGRTKRRVLTGDYVAEMGALQKRLQNVGPHRGNGDQPAPTASVHNKNQSNEIVKASKPTEKKGVRFAPSLDVQELPKPALGARNPISPTAAPKSTSQPMLASIIERPYNPSDGQDAAAESPDEFDPPLMKQEVAIEYHKMRNRIIQKQGGFMKKSEEDKEGKIPLTEAEGGPKKMSRFKAARLRKG